MTIPPTEPRKTPPPVKAAPRPRKPRAPRVEPRPQPARTDMRLTAWIAAVVILIDQALKYWVVHVLDLDRIREIDVLPPWLNLRMAWNQGVNFGLFSSDEAVMRWVLIGIALAVCLWVWLWLRRSRAGILARLSAGLLIGGALGNVIDRLTYGAVADFLNMSLPGWENPYSFNIADIAIFAGAIGLVLMPAEPRAPAETATPAPARKSPAKPATRSTTRSAAPAGPAAEPAGPDADKTRDEPGNAR